MLNSENVLFACSDLVISGVGVLYNQLGLLLKPPNFFRELFNFLCPGLNLLHLALDVHCNSTDLLTFDHKLGDVWKVCYYHRQDEDDGRDGQESLPIDSLISKQENSDGNSIDRNKRAQKFSHSESHVEAMAITIIFVATLVFIWVFLKGTH
ncbi:MAG: hypothetical protein JWO19_4253 [Bryobacterales bacterium]|nr:hypothetical protein [Bryobacterales bacterium]